MCESINDASTHTKARAQNNTEQQRERTEQYRATCVPTSVRVVVVEEELEAEGEANELHRKHNRPDVVVMIMVLE